MKAKPEIIHLDFCLRDTSARRANVAHSLVTCLVTWRLPSPYAILELVIMGRLVHWLLYYGNCEDIRIQGFSRSTKFWGSSMQCWAKLRIIMRTLSLALQQFGASFAVWLALSHVLFWQTWLSSHTLLKHSTTCLMANQPGVYIDWPRVLLNTRASGTGNNWRRAMGEELSWYLDTSKCVRPE